MMLRVKELRQKIVTLTSIMVERLLQGVTSKEQLEKY